MMSAAILKALRDDLSLPRRPTQADFDDMVRKRRRDIRHITEQLARRELTPSEWADRFDTILMTGHSRAWYLGRRLSGDLRDWNQDDMLAGRAAKDGDADFLRSFQDAIESRDPKYFDPDGNLRQSTVINRTNLYLGKMRGTAAEAFVAASPVEAEFDWILGVTEQHCDDCPRMALLSPFAKDTLWTVPGGGDTECLGNCKCYIRRRADRLACFKAEGLPGKPRGHESQGPGAVSDALDVNASYPTSARINEAISLIDSTHTDGVLPETLIESAVLSPNLGGFFNPVHSEIVVNAVSQDPITTMLHETGHLIDLHGIGTAGKFASPRSRQMKDWRDAVRKTESFRRIQDIRAGKTIIVDGIEIEIDDAMRAHAAYLNTWEEYWARSYAQFIAKRTSSAYLTIETLNLLNSEYQKVFKAMWNDRDFDAIEVAIVKLFVELGWMQG